MEKERKYQLMRAPFWVRWAARIVARHMMRLGSESYQVSGKINWMYKADTHANIKAPREQIVHWILRSCGWAVCVADVLQHYLGVNPAAKSKVLRDDRKKVGEQ